MRPTTRLLALGISALCTLGSPAAAAANHQGLWYAHPAESESGWGINFAHQGEIIFATWFTYDASGKAWWLVMIASQQSDGSFSGAILQTRGPAFSASPFNPSAVTTSPVGEGRIAFDAQGNGTFAYTVNGISQAKAITRQVFGARPDCVFGLHGDLTRATNYQDLWFASPAESEAGWGINFAHQGATLFATWFTYDASGAPMWLVGVAPQTAPRTFSGELLRTTGPAFNAVPFTPANVTRTTVGTIAVTFADGNNGTFQYTLDGVTQSKAITRQVFRTPGTACQFAEGVWVGTTDHGRKATVVVLDGGAHYIYWGPPGGSGGHVVHGTAQMDAGTLTAAARDYPVAVGPETDDVTSAYAVNGTYAAGGQMALALTGPAGNRTVAAAFEAGSNGRADVATIAGLYAGISGHVNGRRTAEFVVGASGAFTGVNDAGCSFRGTLTPRAAARVFDMVLERFAGGCIFGQRVTGIAHYDEELRELRLFGPYANGADLYYVIGTRR